MEKCGKCGLVPDNQNDCRGYGTASCGHPVVAPNTDVHGFRTSAGIRRYCPLEVEAAERNRITNHNLSSA